MLPLQPIRNKKTTYKVVELQGHAGRWSVDLDLIALKIMVFAEPTSTYSICGKGCNHGTITQPIESEERGAYSACRAPFIKAVETMCDDLMDYFRVAKNIILCGVLDDMVGEDDKPMRVTIADLYIGGTTYVSCRWLNHLSYEFVYEPFQEHTLQRVKTKLGHGVNYVPLKKVIGHGRAGGQRGWKANTAAVELFWQLHHPHKRDFLKAGQEMTEFSEDYAGYIFDQMEDTDEGREAQVEVRMEGTNEIEMFIPRPTVFGWIDDILRILQDKRNNLHRQFTDLHFQVVETGYWDW